MKGIRILFCLILIVAAGGANVATAQFPIKIPKINKPKAEKPQSDQSKTGGENPAPTDGKMPALTCRKRE